MTVITLNKNFNLAFPAPAARAAKNGGDEPRRGVSNRRHLLGTEDLPSREDRGAGERRRPARRPSTDAAVKVRSHPADLICSNLHSICRFAWAAHLRLRRTYWLKACAKLWIDRPHVLFPMRAHSPRRYSENLSPFLVLSVG